jgi:hypothetical protein
MFDYYCRRKTFQRVSSSKFRLNFLKAGIEIKEKISIIEITTRISVTVKTFIIYFIAPSMLYIG